MDCSSYTELMLSDACGFHGADIMFSSNDTPPEDFRLAKKLGAIINLDDLTHVAFLNEVAGIPETICCRYNPGGTFRTANGIMDNPGEAKYGMTYDQMAEAYRELRRLGAKRFGIHAFLASNTQTEEYYPELARILFGLAVKLRDETGADIRFVNLSGGVGIPLHAGRQARRHPPRWARGSRKRSGKCWCLRAWEMPLCSRSLGVLCWGRTAAL